MHFFTKSEKENKNKWNEHGRQLMMILVREEDGQHSVNLKMRVTIQLLTLMTFLINLTSCFVNVGSKLASNIQNTGKIILITFMSNSMYMKPIVELEILKLVDQLKPNRSAGHDEIGNFITKKKKKSERWIVKPLTCIYNLSLTTGVVLEKLKVAKVIPIYKRLMLKHS